MKLKLALPIALLFAVLSVPSAAAHAELVSANPAVGSVLKSLPQEVSVTFDGNLLTIGGSKTNVLTVTDSRGKEIDAKNSHVSGAILTVGLNSVASSGDFLVRWRVVSGDGHPEESSYHFVVAGPSASSTPLPSASTIANPSLHTSSFWTKYGTRLLLLLAGVVAFGIWFGFERLRRR